MTCTTMTSVPRESFLAKAKHWLFGVAPIKVGQETKEKPAIRNMRMKDLPPHILRDIGLSDVHAVHRYK